MSAHRLIPGKVARRKALADAATTAEDSGIRARRHGRMSREFPAYMRPVETIPDRAPKRAGDVFTRGTQLPLRLLVPLCALLGLLIALAAYLRSADAAPMVEDTDGDSSLDADADALAADGWV